MKHKLPAVDAAGVKGSFLHLLLIAYTSIALAYFTAKVLEKARASFT